LQESLKTHETSAIRDRGFVRNDMPYLAVVVTYGPRPRSAEPAPRTRRP